MTVLQLKKGQTATITCVNAPEKARARLSSLGFVSGQKVTLLGYSLFKSSVLLGCGAVRIAVRKEIALNIEVTL